MLISIIWKLKDETIHRKNLRDKTGREKQKKLTETIRIMLLINKQCDRESQVVNLKASKEVGAKDDDAHTEYKSTYKYWDINSNDWSNFIKKRSV